ncbi:MAG TPA: DinB family protein, partial [Gemmatimonadaceae bacterium]|nr:DinB family protein [Gemmatimonadaceae bacterium]
LHERWVGLLRAMSASDFGRKLTHPEWDAPLSLDSMLALYAWHGPHHTAHITSLRKQRGW